LSITNFNGFSVDIKSPLIAELLNRGLITSSDVDRATPVLGGGKVRVDSVLLRLGAISEEKLLPVLADVYGFTLLTQEQLPQDPYTYIAAIEQTGIPKNWWLAQEVLVWEESEGKYRCIIRDPFNITSFDVISRALPDTDIEQCIVKNYEFERAFDAVAQIHNSNMDTIYADKHLRELAEAAPVVEFVQSVMSQGYEQRASDIHVEPAELNFAIRYRIDGVLHSKFTLPGERYPAIVSRIKLISGMDISERRLPQDGRFSIRLGGDEVDVRVSSAPGVHGESVVMRLLAKTRQAFNLQYLGLEPDHEDELKKWLHQPHGIILVTGPTGSGKSTTLYSALNYIDKEQNKVITVEDPVEYQLKGVTQIQAHSEIGYTFAHALRSILRQDPDIIMLGEIRDTETAEISIQAALTGHLVLSTLHTNDAISAFNRLIDMGIEPFLVATPIHAVMAQRLLRRLCDTCKAPADRSGLESEVVMPNGYATADGKWMKPVGCAKCQHTGYSGRVGIYELIPVDQTVQKMIVNRSSNADIKEYVDSMGHRSLRGDGLIKAWHGITSLEEVIRVTSV
jgi:general secretion pathway protein E